MYVCIYLFVWSSVSVHPLICAIILIFMNRGVLAIAWSLADPELLLSCGKDSRILCWNPNTAEVESNLSSEKVFTNSAKNLFTL